MIGIGSDHGGFLMKEAIKKFLQDKGIEYKDFGSYTPDSVDYPDIAISVASSIVSKECECGILICGTGIGMSIAANKINGIRAAHVTDSYSARMTREHNDANIICLGARITGEEIAFEIIRAYLGAEFAGGRHLNRVNKITALEK